ncbi:MAG: FeoA family protein [Eubacteriales bacterium]|nr:FeoA family protein [Eubacteriales bacterium]
MMPILLSTIGEENIIRKIGGSPEIKQHLADLGFVVGGDATLVSLVGENAIIKVKETRVALSKELAQKVMV